MYGVPTPTGYADQGESSWHHVVSCMMRMRVSAKAPDSPSKSPCMILDSARIRHLKPTRSPVSFGIAAGNNMLLQHCALFSSAPDCQNERKLPEMCGELPPARTAKLVCTGCLLRLTYSDVVQPPRHCSCTRPRAQAATTCSLHTTALPTRCPPSSHPGRPSCKSMPAMRQTPSSVSTPLHPLKANPAPSQSVSPATIFIGLNGLDDKLIQGIYRGQRETHILGTGLCLQC